MKFKGNYFNQDYQFICYIDMIDSIFIFNFVFKYLVCDQLVIFKQNVLVFLWMNNYCQLIFFLFIFRII